MAASNTFGDQFGRLLDDHLAEQETSRQAVSRFASGAAFEAWLSFEARLLLESYRAELSLAGLTMDRFQEPVDRYWIANEHAKVDLGVLDVGDESRTWEIALEFKIIHNNKNWKSKCDEIWGDLLPRAGAPKASIIPRRGRYAIVAVVGKVYRDPGPYGWRPDLADWERELWQYLLPESGEYAGMLLRLWQGRRFTLADCWLVKDAPSFCELHVLAPSGSTQATAGAWSP